MKIRVEDIADKLGISKATVSLALNGRKGVSEKTRDTVFKCREEMEKKTENVQRIIRMVIYRKSGYVLDIKSIEDQLNEKMKFSMKKLLHRDEYKWDINWFFEGKTKTEDFIKECNAPEVAGIVLRAAELNEEGFKKFTKIRKPMVILDNDFGNDYHNVVIDNYNASKELINYLVDHRCTKIKYLSKNVNMYNFNCRRLGFIRGLYENRIDWPDNKILNVGDEIADIEAFMTEWLKKNRLPDAFVCENYQVSIGVTEVLLKSGYHIPKDISVVGIDKVPHIFENAIQLTTMKVSHAERGELALKLLLEEIKNPYSFKITIQSKCLLLLGNSVSGTGERIREK